MPLAIQIHLAAALAALALGAVLLAAPKGTIPHRLIGWVWAGLVLTVALSAFFIHRLRVWGEWSPFHLLAVLTLAALPLALWRAHRHQVAAHRRGMIATFAFGLILPGLFALLPGRMLSALLFGP
jgi:uncharacterized membrane protein